MNAPLPILRSALLGLRERVSARAGHWLERARAKAAASPATLGGHLDPVHALEFLTRLREGPLPAGVERVSGQVQRLGERAFARLLKRWPALSDLVVDPAKALRARPRPKAKAPDSAPPLEEGALEALIVQLVAAPTWQSRAGAAAALAYLDGEGVFEALARAVRDTSVEVAIAAIDALARRSDPRASAALLAVLENRDGYYNPVTRVAALSALGHTLEDAELAPVMACVRDVDAEVSIAAIAVVAERKRATAAEHLLPVLQDASGYFLPLVRLAAANGLTRAGALSPELARQLLDAERSAAVRKVLERVAQCPPSSSVSG